MAIIKIRNQAIDLDEAEIPNLDASKITSGTLADARIPNLDTTKITSGTLADARIPNLDTTKITSGTLADARFPTTLPAINGASLTGIQGVNTGLIVPYGKDDVPTGFLACDGAAVSRTTYSDLFTVIGTTWGTGDGSSTFNVPDLQDKAPLGKSGSKAHASTGGAETVTPSGSVSVSVNNHTISTAQMPSHNHNRTSNWTDDWGGGGSNNFIGGDQNRSPGSGVNAAMPSSGSSNSHNHGSSASFSGSSLSVLQPYVALKYIIKT